MNALLSTLFLLLLNLLFTGFMTGLIWFVQIVHYPIFARVAPDYFRGFHAAHMSLTGRVVILPMLIELGLAFVLAFRVSGWMSWAALALVGVAWLSTFLFSVPAHGQLGEGFNAEAITRLVATNWIRCWAWTLRAGLLVYMVVRFFLEQQVG